MRLELGTRVRCLDGPAGELADIVIDPRTRRVTHLVVEPPDRPDLARLVPAERARAEAAHDESVALDYTVAEIGQLDPLRKLAYVRLGELPQEDADSAVGVEDVSVQPSYQSFGLDGPGAGTPAIDYDPHVAVSYDRIPKGCVEIRRSSAVTSCDGEHLGHVIGLVVDSENQIARVLLERGHLWRRREVAVAHSAVARLQTDEVTLSLSKDEVGELEPRET